MPHHMQNILNSLTSVITKIQQHSWVESTCTTPVVFYNFKFHFESCPVLCHNASLDNSYASPMVLGCRLRFLPCLPLFFLTVTFSALCIEQAAVFKSLVTCIVNLFNHPAPFFASSLNHSKCYAFFSSLFFFQPAVLHFSTILPTLHTHQSCFPHPSSCTMLL